MAWSKAKMAIVTAAVVLLAVGGGTAIYEVQQNSTTGAPAKIRVKWMVGKKYELHSEMNQSAEIKSPGQSRPVDEGLKWTQDFNISALKKLPAGGWQLELEFVNEALVSSQNGHNVLSFDSAQSRAVDKHNPLSILGALIGARLDYFLNADGKVQSIEGLNQLTNHIAEVGTVAQRQVFNSLFGGYNLQHYISNENQVPNRIVSIGESWSDNDDFTNVNGVVAVQKKYTFKNWEQHGGHQCAHILGTGNASTKSISTASGRMTKIEKGKISDELWFDPELGLLGSGNENQDYIFKVTTRTETITGEEHAKIQWLLTDAQ